LSKGIPFRLWTGETAPTHGIGKLIVWGGIDNYWGSWLNSGGFTILHRHLDADLDGGSLPTFRDRHTAVWRADRMIVWGGNYGGRSTMVHSYNPAADEWSPWSP